MVSRRLFLVSAAVLIAVALPLWSARLLSAQSKQSAPAEEIARIRSEWAKLLHAKQLDPLMALYASDAVFLQPSGERITGKPAIRDLCKKIMEAFTSDITLHGIDTEHSGDLAYDSGEYNEALIKLSDGSKAEVQGNYLMVFKRQPDGSWLIVQQMWSLVTPPTE
jgi:ketosteroid isomerase-like protein